MNKEKTISDLIKQSYPLDPNLENIGLRYLKNRGLQLSSKLSDLRFTTEAYNAELRRNAPAIIAIARHPVSLDVLGLHRIFLNEKSEKAKVKDPKKYVGTKNGAVIFLDTPKEVVNIAEGIETALSVQIATNLPTVSVIDAGNMKKYLPSETIKTVHIWADKDTSSTGMKSARFLATSLIKLGFQVYVHEPTDEINPNSKGVDWLDVYNKHGKEKFLESMINTKTFDEVLKIESQKQEEKQLKSKNETKMGHDERGIYINSDFSKEYITTPVQLLYECRSDIGERWSKVLEVIDPDGKKHEVTVAYEDFACAPNEVLRVLSSRGFQVRLFKPLEVIHYLNQLAVQTRKNLVSQTGWQTNGFLTQSYAVGPDADNYIFDSTELKVKLELLGTLSDWKKNVAALAKNNPTLATALSLSFVGPLLKFQKLQNFGLHFNGPSSCGKSTAAKMAASVWSKPFSKDSFVQTWRTTGNALEGMAAAHNHLILILDEISEANESEIKNICYMLGNGQSKSRANQIGQAQAKKYFSLVYLSNGEESLESIATNRQDNIKAGQEVRFIEIEADNGLGYGILQELHGYRTSKELITNLEESMRNNYGCAGKGYLEKLCEFLENENDLIKKIEAFREEFLKHLEVGLNQQVLRVADSFSLIAAAGELANEFGILPFDKGEVSDLVFKVFEKWKCAKDRSNLSDDQRALEQVKHFFETDGDSRFSKENEAGFDLDPGRSLKRAGFKVMHNGLESWFVLPEVFKKEVCKGFPSKQVAKTLKDLGCLITQENSLHISKTINGQTYRGYCISTGILNL